MKQPVVTLRPATARILLFSVVLLLAGVGCARSLRSVPLSFNLLPAATETPEQMVPTDQPSEPEEEEPAMPSVKITITYNNIASDPRLETDWGFSAYIEMGEQVILFDTGTKGDLLLRNMETLGLDPARVDFLVLSHLHNDHIGGTAAVLGAGASPTVYILENFPAGFQERLSAVTGVIVVDQPQRITDGVYTTGPVPGDVTEQALVVETGEGLVVLTGCAHPGVNRMVAQAKETAPGEVHLVLGGFHLGSSSQAQVEAIIADFRELGVQHAAPSHCTGDAAMRQFDQAFGSIYSSGLGAVLEFPGAASLPAEER